MVVNIADKLGQIESFWDPRRIASLNGQDVRLARLKGEFVWHAHEAEDELFLVLSGQLRMEFRDRVELLGPGELLVVPRGVEHRPVAEDEVAVLLFEPSSTINTGDADSPLRRERIEAL